jgi:AcrR family transcriptional regulator
MVFVSGPLPEPPRRGRAATPARVAARPRLTRERIVEAALGVVDARGLDALSMRAVGDALGTGPASLYAHVADKDELLALLVERIVAELELPEPDPDHWQEQLKAMVRALHSGLLTHDDLARAALAEVPLGEGGLRFTERLLEILRLGGLPDQVVAYGSDLLMLYAVATAYEEAARDDGYVADVRAYRGALPADRFPHLAALGGLLGAGERFEFGLDVLVTGLAAYGRRRRSTAAG